MGEKGKLGPEDNTAGFQVNPQNINKKGRPPSIRRHLKELLELEGKMVIPHLSILETKKNGDVVISIPNQEKIALKLQQLAMSGKGSVTLRAIKMIIEQLEGKVPQTKIIIDQGLDLSLLDLDERKLYLSLVRKATPTEEETEKEELKSGF